MSILYRYLSRLILRCFCLVFLFLLGMHFLIELTYEISFLGTGQYDVPTMLSCICLGLPENLYEFVPVGSMLSFVAALSILARRQELVIMRVSGVSLLRMGGWVIFNGMLLVSSLMVAGEWGIPYCSNLARTIKTRALSGGQIKITASGIWLRSDREIVHIGGVIDGKLRDIVCYRLNEDGNGLARISYARMGARVANGWRLEENNATVFGRDGSNVMVDQSGQNVKEVAMLPINLSPQLLFGAEIRAGEQNLLQLQDTIRYRRECGLSTRAQELAWWMRAFSPFNAIFMILLALPLVLSAVGQRGDSSLKLLLGIILGFGFYVFHRVISLIGVLRFADVSLVAAMPTLLSMVVCLWWMRRVR